MFAYRCHNLPLHLTLMKTPPSEDLDPALLAVKDTETPLVKNIFIYSYESVKKFRQKHYLC